jgi:hypothetical protein
MNELYLASFIGLNSTLDGYENKEIIIEASNALQAKDVWRVLKERHKLTCGDYEWKDGCFIHPLMVYRAQDILKEVDDDDSKTCD